MTRSSPVFRMFASVAALGLTVDALATNHILRQDEIMAGLNGDNRVQFVEITVSGGDQKAWGPPFPGSASRAMLVFFNGSGTEVGRFLFPANAPFGGNTVLIATTNFAALPGAPVPDFIMPALMAAGSGKVCFKGNPASPGAFDVNLCISYGTFPADQTEGAGSPAPALATTGDPISLTRFQNFAFGQVSSRNADFALASPTPLNTRGQTMTFPVDGPEIHTIPTSLDFGVRNIDQGATAPLSLIITNRGVLNPLLITNVALTGANTNEFRILSDSGQTNLPPGGTRTLTLNFDPNNPGRRTASVRIVCNDPNEVITDVPLQGTGVDPNAPEINVTPLTISFADHDAIAGPTPPRNVSIQNQGQIGSLNISNISVIGPHAGEFQMMGPTNSSTLGPGGIRTAPVTFNPSSAGPKTAMLRIISSDTDEGVTDVLLSGRAFDLNPCTAPNASNSVPQNSCANAQLICPGTVFTGTLAANSPDGSSTCGGVQFPDVWGRYVPAGDGTLVATLAVRGGVLVISAHSGCPGGPGNELACLPTAQASTNPLSLRITLPVTNGVPVFIRLGGDTLAPTPFQLVLEGPDCFEFDQNKNRVTDNCEADFGDAPAPYPTVGLNAARHRAFTGVFLGRRIDPDDNGQPTAHATGDNLDGDINDDDGVVLTSPLLPGQSATLEITASTNGFLSAWFDFNSNGDWADPDEQVFTNRALAPGLNALTLNVPANAIATNLTFARYRFSSRSVPSFSGPATDGEVEDYAVEIVSAAQTPGTLAVRINEVMAGLNGDSTVQFVELDASGDANKLWGPQGSESVGRAMLLFFDGGGVLSGRFVFPSNGPTGASTVLVATRAFADATGLQPDFVMPPEVVPIGGKLVFTSNPDNRHFDTQIALSYGGTEYFGITDGAGPANTNRLPIMHARSLMRVQEFQAGLNQNGAFQLAVPTPRNTRGETASLSAIPVAEQGRALFMRETFRGNGRTCATCHVPGRDQFGLTPATIATLPRSDPLFVFEDNVNTLKLTAPSQPSDLRGRVTGATGTALVLSGSGETYLIVGGTNLSGTIADANGNSGAFQSLTQGDLDGPTASNGSARGLEDHTLLEHGRGLILENIDGFKALEVFRASPHLLTLAQTAPFGLSGEFDSLDDFSDGAVVQHFPKSLARISGVDFRHPTAEELAAMSDFMFGISNPSTNAMNLDRLITTEAQKRGRAFFFGDEGRCSKCHSGPALAFSDGSLSGSVSNRNENFNTGVANQLINLVMGDNLPTEPAGLESGSSTREFNTPGLFGIRLTAPFFHDGSAATLAEAVKFYDSDAFHNSPAGVDVGSLLAANKTNMTADVVAFMEALIELPVDFTREVAFGIRCPGQQLPGPQLAWITNLGSTTITITNVVLNGPNTNEFQILSDTGEINLGPGQTRRFQITFAPATLGIKRATLEVTAVDTNLLGSFSFGLALTGADVDNLVTAVPLSFDFGMRDIDAPPSPIESIIVTNVGSLDLDVAIELAGATPGDFTMATETNAIPAGGTRVIQVAFAPRTQGSKSATVRVRMVSCTGTLIEIPLAGVATSTIQHFAWDSIGATQFVGAPFPVRITAVDRNGETVQNFRGTVQLRTIIEGQTNSLVVPDVTSPFLNGLWSGMATVQAAAATAQLVARDNQGHTGLSAQFATHVRDDLSITAVDMPDPVNSGQHLTYTLTVRNTGPADATGVVVTNVLSPGLTFVSGTTPQGTVTHANGVVTAALGTLVRAAVVSISIVVEPRPPAAALAVTNIAVVSRNEPEANLANNSVTNTTRIEPFGLLSVTPIVDFSSSGFSGGPFAPTQHVYTVSNAGTATLNWQARASGCAAPPGLAAWWALDGNTADNVGTNTGIPSGGPVFTNGFVGQALLFNGNSSLRIPASAALNVGTAPGLTMEAWINPATISRQQPIIEWVGPGDVGVQLWISVALPGGGLGDLFANVAESNLTNHKFVSPPNLVQANVWQHVALTYDTNTGLATLYFNGEVAAQQNIGSFMAFTAVDAFIGRQTYEGLIDDIGIYNRALTQAEIQSIFSAAAAGKCGRKSCLLVADAVAWWGLDGNAADSIGTNFAALSGGPVFTNGLVGQALLFDGNDDAVQIPASPALNVGTGPGLTMEAWINPTSVAQQRPIVEWGSPIGIGVQLWISVPIGGSGGPGSMFANVVQGNNPAGPFVHHQVLSPPNLVVANAWQHVALTYNTNTGLATLYLNGAIVGQQNIGSFATFTSADFFIGRRPPVSTFLGLIDEVGVYNRELMQAEIQSIFTAGSEGKCGTRAVLNCIPGMISWWPADGETNDIGDSNPGRLVNGATFGQGFVGGSAFSFDGVDDKVELGDPENLRFTNAFTIDAWVFAHAPRGPDRIGNIFFRGDTRGCLDPYAFWIQLDGRLVLHVEDGSPICGVKLVAPTPLPTNQWKHVAGVFDAGLMRIFIDGVLVTQTNTTVRPFRDLDSTGSVAIGNHSGPFNGQGFNGLIDELAVYGRGLSAAEIQSIFTAGAAGKCRQSSWLTLSTFGGALAPGAGTNVMLNINSNANRLGIGNYSETVGFTNVTHRRGSTERMASLAVLNRAPTLAAPGPIQIAEDSGPLSVNLLGIFAGGAEVQQLNVSAFSSNPSLIANPVAVNYINPATNGTLTFASLPDAHGTSLISVVVRDNGGTGNGAVDSVTNAFLVTVTPVNDAPTVPLLLTQMAFEGAVLTISNMADDVDLPDDQLNFSLPGAPEGLVLDAQTRVLSWQPLEAQGPGIYPITLEVSDSGVPPLRATNHFTITVLEVNEPPSMLPIADRTVHRGATVAFNCFATDPDLPANGFTYGFGADVPSGATITPAGAFAWTAAATGTNRVSLLVSDNGSPVLSDMFSFNILVVDRPVIQSITRSGEVVTLTWTAIPGARYRLQTKATLGDASVDWSDLPGDITATSESASASDSITLSTQRFYKVLVLPP